MTRSSAPRARRWPVTWINIVCPSVCRWDIRSVSTDAAVLPRLFLDVLQPANLSRGAQESSWHPLCHVFPLGNLQYDDHPGGLPVDAITSSTPARVCSAEGTVCRADA